ncbi:hypothetical protein [Nocardia brasiliensis]|uniref:hypothetical protein n=1 Tax=Nocardia brasiliensis TaxID=37326 RepID=UPI00245757DC|nr:hypothetical protein [Nocardia brasiliensis]
MNRHHLIAVLAAVLATLAVATAIGAATAAAQPPDLGSETESLPSGFPADLRQFVGGTDEFGTAPWFSGECADRGGDIGRYVNAVMGVEDRLMYWSGTAEQKKAMLGGTGVDSDAARWIQEGIEPPKDLLPKVFPAGDASFGMPSPVCAEDVKRWASPAWNTWGFDWAKTPDRQSMHEITKVTGEDFSAVPGQAWTDPCKVHQSYCAHAFFADCTRADTATGDLVRCLDWNRAVGTLFVGTAKWLDRNTSFGDRLGEAVFGATGHSAGGAFTRAFTWLWDATGKVVRFVEDPQSVIDDWANSSKASASELSAKVLDGLAATGRFDPAAAWFLRWYALSTGIGVMVMGLMTLMALWRAASRGETVKTIAGDLFGYMPAGLLLMLFAPMLAAMIVEAANLASEAIARMAGPDMGDMIDHLKRFTGELTATDLAGGVLVGLFLFLLLIVCALSVFAGLLMHQVALPCLAVAAGIGFGMWVHPQWRKKALRPVLVFVAIVASKPLLFLLLATLTGVIDAGLTDTAEQLPLGTLGQLCLVVVAFGVAGLAPWSLLRYAPLLPSRSDAPGFGQSPSLMAGAVGGAGTAMWWSSRGAGAKGRGGRESASGEGGGGGGGSGDPGWRTAGSSDGRSATESRFGQTLARNTGDPTGSGSSGGKRGIGEAGRTATGTARRLGSAAMSAGMVAAPIAAQAASGALSKARSTAEAAPGDAESESS